jgi:two-component system, sensor histidine kinase and response regulator
MSQLPTILYVDDERDNLTMFSSAFFEHYDILTASTIAEAKELLAKYPVQVVISDQRMPEMTGATFLASSLGSRPDAIRMLVTGFSDIEDAIAAINQGRVHRYIKKPWDNAEFKVTIDEAIQFYLVQNERDELLRTLEEKVKQRTEELEAANQKLEVQNHQLIALNQDKNEFLGIAAHDLKNPLSNIKMLSKVLQDEAPTLGKDEVREFSSHIVNASEQMFTLITNLLDVNAIEQGGVKVNPVNFDVAPVVQSVVDNYVGRATAKNITLNFELKSNGAPAATVFADQTATLQVLDNLISNAVKYSPHGKSVFVRVVKSTSGSSSAGWRCEVQDQGPGLSDDDKSKLFGKFARLSARPTGDEHSTGLGLSIVKKMVESMNGKVWCESELGKGATFILELPAGA